ncbi:hypothetical protein TNCV_30561 [Trichonephila clavipes]|nr:hypothetical protein TNCV_30561 [Trichonephila clavipes]
MSRLKRPPVGLVWKLGEGCRLRCRPPPLTMVQYYEANSQKPSSSWNSVTLVFIQPSTPHSAVGTEAVTKFCRKELQKSLYILPYLVTVSFSSN